MEIRKLCATSTALGIFLLASLAAGAQVNVTTWHNDLARSGVNSQETILYNFCSQTNCADGSVPSPGNIVIRGGALYGSTGEGGQYGSGIVYSLTK